MLVDPETVLDQDREVVLDAREARLLQTEAPQRTEDRQRKVDFQLIDGTGHGGAQRLRRSPPTYDDVYVSPTEPMTRGRVHPDHPLAQGRAAARPQRPPAATVRFEHDRAAGKHARRRQSRHGAHGRTRATARRPTTSGINARGKVVVVDRSDEVGPEERAAAAARRRRDGR